MARPPSSAIAQEAKPPHSKYVIDGGRFIIASLVGGRAIRAPLIYERYNILLASELLDLSKSQAQIRQA